MGVVITFSDAPTESVLLAGWIYRQLKQDALASLSGQDELKQALEGGEVISGLDLPVLPPEIAGQMLQIIRTTATGILSGTLRSGIMDQPFYTPEAVATYKDGLQLVLNALPQQSSAEEPVTSA